MKIILSYLKPLFFDDSKKMSSRELTTALSLLWFCYVFSLIYYGANVFISAQIYQRTSEYSISVIPIMLQIAGLVRGGIHFPWAFLLLAGSIGLVYRGFGKSFSIGIKLVLGLVLFLAIRSIFILPFLFTSYPGKLMGQSHPDDLLMIATTLAPLKWALTAIMTLGISMVIFFYSSVRKEKFLKSPVKGLDREGYTLRSMLLFWLFFFGSILFVTLTILLLDGEFDNPYLLITESLAFLVLSILGIIFMIKRIHNSVAGFVYLAFIPMISLIAAGGYALILFAPQIMLKNMGGTIIHISMTALCLFHFGLMLLPGTEDKT